MGAVLIVEGFIITLGPRLIEAQYRHVLPLPARQGMAKEVDHVLKLRASTLK